MTHSTDLQWQIVRHNSKFLQKRGGLRLSNDPFNNNGNWTKRQSGFLNERAAVVKTVGDRIYATLKNGQNTNKPKSAYTKTVFDANVKAGKVRQAVAAVRPDLASVAYKRARKMAILTTRAKKVRAARKERSSKIQYKHKAIRPKRK